MSERGDQAFELSIEEASKLARLARLRLTDEQLQGLRGQLGRIVGFVEQLAEVDVDGVAPMTHAVPVTPRRRPDEPADEVAGRRALEGSAGYEDGLVRVPRIVE